MRMKMRVRRWSKEVEPKREVQVEEEESSGRWSLASASTMHLKP